ncbi:hypothetical protein ACRBEV_12550 [Methylobacterium phyllosphaerae]
MIDPSTFISIIAAVVPATLEKTLAVAMAEDIGERAAGDRGGDVQEDVVGTVGLSETFWVGLVPHPFPLKSRFSHGSSNRDSRADT